jgi:hypothetical protein
MAHGRELVSAEGSTKEQMKISPIAVPNRERHDLRQVHTPGLNYAICGLQEF